MRGMTDRIETFSDKLLGFTIPARNARGKAVRLDRAIDEILAAHDYPPAITRICWPKRLCWLR